MQATELRLGNRIITHDGFGKPHKDTVRFIARAFPTSKDIYVFGEIIYANPVKEVKGIPINHRWLKKFGFEKISHEEYRRENSQFWMFCNEDNIYSAWLIDKDNLDTDYDLPLKTIKYVHQLQNLYFSLTGKELQSKTINYV